MNHINLSSAYTLHLNVLTLHFASSLSIPIRGGHPYTILTRAAAQQLSTAYR